MPTVDFQILQRKGLRPDEAVLEAAEAGATRLQILKGLADGWGVNLCGPDRQTSDKAGYPTIEACEAATIALGALLLRYPHASAEEFDRFEAETDISQKVHALAMANRITDAIAFHERLFDDRLGLTPLTAEASRVLVADFIQEDLGALRIQDHSTLRYPWGAIYLYQSAEYLDTGDFSKMVAGNAPLLVDRYTGALWVTGTKERPDHYVEMYERTGSPNPIDVA